MKPLMTLTFITTLFAMSGVANAEDQSFEIAQASWVGSDFISPVFGPSFFGLQANIPFPKPSPSHDIQHQRDPHKQRRALAPPYMDHPQE